MTNTNEQKTALAATERGAAPDKTARRQRIFDIVSKIGFLVCAVFSVFAILAIILFLLASSIPGMAEVGFFKFLFGTTWKPTSSKLPIDERFGILPMIAGTLYVTALSVLIGGVTGVLAAIFIARFCPKKVKPVIRQAMNLLAGLPSVIYGFFGLVVLVPFVRDTAIKWGMDSAKVQGYGVLVSALVLSVMILPTVITLSVNALESQPHSYYEGALALGATKDQAVIKVLVPASKSGILAGMVLGVGRAMGETMAVVLVCGNSAVMPGSLVTGMETMTALIALEMGYAGELHRTMLIATGFVLLIFVLLLTLSLNLLRRKKK